MDNKRMNWRYQGMKKKNFLIVLLMIALMVGGCTSISNMNPVPLSEDDSRNSPTPNQDGSERPGNTVIDAKLKDTFITSNQDFSWDIFQELNQEDSGKDIFFSPFSISSMLTLALNGAEGTTRGFIEKTLHYEELSRDELNVSYASLIQKISDLDKKVTIEIANSIWAREGFEIKADYLSTNQKYLSAEVRTLDFSDMKSADVINDWISNKTNHLIPKMITPPIPPDVIMYLINAIYFKGDWRDKFEEKNTLAKDFYAMDGKTDKVSMMHRSGRIEYQQQDHMKAVRLPYGNGNTSMVVILPENINEWIGHMNSEKWKELLEGFHPVHDLQLQLPKFKMEYGIKELNKSLTSLGMGEAFTDSANFSGIAEDIFISKIMHKAVIDVNEKGTEAAAVTVGEIVATSARSEPVTFIANRPFVYIITDNDDGNILFMGKKIFGDR